ncbi:hypothetical protein [Chryseobacterium turcicum]|uniref:Uncharacterized protein n=1 Tax=Chryseobacterium turcicum TaxID=2898076 RepID=A0A9Q3V0I4_9FLAO|nr:hypothetical protein [Chryseobacterium turcicum]MCD1115508.1 hypothetical protein [Chryseobacterium turcicum]
MTSQEFEEEVKGFSIKKDDLKEKVDELFGNGAGTIHILYFIVEHKNCKLIEAMEIIEYSPNYYKRFK